MADESWGQGVKTLSEAHVGEWKERGRAWSSIEKTCLYWSLYSSRRNQGILCIKDFGRVNDLMGCLGKERTGSSGKLILFYHSLSQLKTIVVLCTHQTMPHFSYSYCQHFCPHMAPTSGQRVSIAHSNPLKITVQLSRKKKIKDPPHRAAAEETWILIPDKQST